MAAIFKIKMAIKKTTTSNFPSALITSLSIISIGSATILNSRGAPEELRSWNIGQNMLKMAAILKSKMAAKIEMTSNFLSTFIAINEITNIGIGIILTSFLGSEIEI